VKQLALPKITMWRAVFIVLAILGLYSTWIRFAKGLGASTNLTDEFPWGLWIGFDVLCGVMLAAGGFTLMATVHIFNAEKFKPIVRPALLTAYLGYLLVCMALMYDLGFPWRIWHPLIMWNPKSVMFEVGWCVTLYTTVLTLEFAPIVFERLRMPKIIRVLHLISMPLVILGVILSTLHQSSLGTVYLITLGKLHPLWYSPLLPVFFFLSALAVGIAMTIVESSLSERHFGHQLDRGILFALGRILMVLLSLYAILRFQDLYHRGVAGLSFNGTYESNLFLAEIILGLVMPLLLLAVPRIRENKKALYAVSLMVVFGFVINRLNVSITGMEASSGVRYLPKWTEVSVTLFIVAVGIAAFGWCVKNLPIFHSEEEHAEVHGEVAKPAVAPPNAAPVHS
jgi:Ni/Fe-hydrogenase subunit HybB-like protein